MAHTYTAVYKKVKGWYVGYVEELPGANTQGRTLKEVRENLQEAVELILQANRELLEKEMRGKGVIREKIAVAIE
jgi:predicted RNase H-like HicB family nuclease